MTTVPGVGACPECGDPLAAVDVVPNPRTARLQRVARPCGHLLGPHEWEAAVEAGIGGTILPVTGATLTGAERTRQITEEGFTLDYDQQHSGGQLAWAVWALLDRVLKPDSNEQAPPMWLFDRDKWPQDKSALRLLIIAGAMVCAEIDRRLAKGERP